MLDLSEGKARRVVGEAWALSLSPDGRTLNTTTHDGRVILWDTSSLKKIGEMETKGSFGTSIASVLSPLNHKSNCSLLIDDMDVTVDGERRCKTSVVVRENTEGLYTLPGTQLSSQV